MVFRGTETNAKTVLCTRFTSPEGCRFGDRCNFAHGTVEIRPRPECPVSRGRSSQNGFPEESNGYSKSTGSAQFQNKASAWTGGESPRDSFGSQQAGGTSNGNGSHWPASNGHSSWASAASNGASHNGLLGNGSASFLTSHAAVVPALSQRGPEPSNHGWSQHTAPEGYQYYYNSVTGVSQWERPMELDFPLTSQRV